MMPELADEWTTTSWNPVTGRDRISTGCGRCYALQFGRAWEQRPQELASPTA